MVATAEALATLYLTYGQDRYLLEQHYRLSPATETEQVLSSIPGHVAHAPSLQQPPKGPVKSVKEGI